MTYFHKTPVQWVFYRLKSTAENDATHHVVYTHWRCQNTLTCLRWTKCWAERSHLNFPIFQIFHNKFWYWNGVPVHLKALLTIMWGQPCYNQDRIKQKKLQFLEIEQTTFGFQYNHRHLLKIQPYIHELQHCPLSYEKSHYFVLKLKSFTFF